MRLFIAINFNEKVKNELLDMQRLIRNNTMRGNFTHAENLHLTVVFIGETPHWRLPEVKTAMSEAGVAGFTLTINGLGSFKRGDRGGDIYWAGVEASETLTALHRNMAAALKAQGFDIDGKPYTPHLTLAREVVLNRHATPFSDHRVIKTTVDRVSLMLSEHKNGALTYTEIHHQML